MFFDKRKSIRFTEGTIKEAETILKMFALDYNSFSDIIRSAVSLMYRVKVKKDLEIRTIRGTKWEF